MANQFAVVSATLVDSWGTEASAPAFALADDTKTLAAVVAEAQAYVSALDAASDAYVRKMHIQIVPALPGGLKTAAVGTGARVEQTGLLGFGVTGSSKRYSLAIPAVADSTLTADRMTLGSGAIAALLLILTTVGTALKWANEHSQQINAFIDALVSFRKKRKQLARSSFELP